MRIHWIGILLLLGSCASVHPGKMGETLEGTPDPLVLISAQRHADVSDEHYTFITFTTENKGNGMLRILSTELSFEPEVEKQVSILVGKDLLAWAEATEEEQKKNEQNKRIVKLALLIGGGLGLASGGMNSKTVAAISGGALAAGAAWSITDIVSKSMAAATTPKKVPETHIYSPFSVPAGKFIRRWVVIQKPPTVDIKRVFLKVRFEDDTEKRYAFDL